MKWQKKHGYGDLKIDLLSLQLIYQKKHNIKTDKFSRKISNNTEW